MKLCPWHIGRRCYVSSCSLFYLSSGDVGCCPAHGNPDGYFMPKKVVGSHLSIIQIWASSRKK
jgi:hypothetical protein